MWVLRSPLRLLVLSCHGALLLGVGGLVWNALHASPARELTLGAAVLPLLVTVPGLVNGRRSSEQWLTLLLVVYAGAAAVEVVANAGAAFFGSLALLASLCDLGLLLAIIRRSRLGPPTARG